MPRRKTSQVGATPQPIDSAPAKASTKKPTDDKRLWKEDVFVNAYCDNGGNASAAYRKSHPGCSPETSWAEGDTWRDRLQSQIEARRAEIRQALNFSREDYLRILIGRASSSPSDFIGLNLNDPDTLAGLGDKKYGLASKDSDRQNAADRLAEMLGFRTMGSSAGSKAPVFRRVLEKVRAS